MIARAVIFGASLAGLVLGLAGDAAAQAPSGSAAAGAAPVLPDWVLTEWHAVPAPGTPAEVLELDRQRENLTGAGRFEEVLPILEKLVVWKAKSLGADHESTLEYVTWLGSMERVTGAWAASERHYRQVLSALERARRTDRVAYRTARSALIGLYMDKGDLERAEPIARKALAEAEANAPQSRVAEALLELAKIRQGRGALAEAEGLLSRALQIVLEHGEPAVRTGALHKDARGKDVFVTTESRTRSGEKAMLGALALVLLDEGKLADAESAVRRALAAGEEVTGPDSVDTSYSWHTLGLVLQAKGDAAGAWKALARALAIREAASGLEHPVLAAVLHAMARLRIAQGAGAEAEALGRRALAILERAYGAEHRRVADVLVDIAEALAVQGRAVEALPFEERAGAIRDREAQIVFLVGSEAQRRVLAAARRKQMDGALSLASAALASAPVVPATGPGEGAAALATAPGEGAAARLALRTVLRSKGRLLDASADEMAALRARLDDGGRAVFDDLARVTAAISASAARGETAEASPQARERLSRLSAERARLEALIADRSAVFRADAALATVEDVARRVPEDAALVEVASYRPFLLPSAKEPRPGATMVPWGEPRYAAYVLRVDDVSAVDLGPAAEVDAAVASLRAALADPDLTHDARPAARAAYDRIFGPIAARLDGVRHVLWSPDGALQLVPLGALVGPDGRWLVESRLVTLLTSARDLLRFEGSAEPRSGPLVIAAPDFGPPGGVASGGAARAEAAPRGAEGAAGTDGVAEGAEAARRGAEGVDMGRIGFLPLPGSVREAEAVARTLASGVVLTGDQATESAVKWAHAPSVLHIATHGFFLPDGEAAAAPGLPASGSEAALALQAESPLVRSGLAFAGANLRASGTEDGILSGLEASSLDLAGTELVVLSACETGLGKAVAGDGVYGLRRAFAIAGAETLVMSLWEVDTGRTRELMTAYYEALAGGAGRSEAMRRAQLGMLAAPATSHPNLWAAFLVSGRWGPLTATKLVAPPKVEPGPRGCGCEVAVGAGSQPDSATNEAPRGRRSAGDRGWSGRAPRDGAAVMLVIAMAAWGARRLSPRRHTSRAR